MPYWQITENCLNLIETLPGLVHDDNRVEDVDQSCVDHAPDAARYTFKALKWLDAKSGGVMSGGYKKRLVQMVQLDNQGKQLPIDLSKFMTHSESSSIINRV